MNVSRLTYHASRITPHASRITPHLPLNTFVMKRLLLHYWLAMNATAIDSAVQASVAYLGVAGAHAALASIPALNLTQLAAVFGITFLRALLAYLAAHPLASLLGSSSSSTPKPQTPNPIPQ